MYDVGIVMPIYIQDPVYLQTAIQSILNQTYRKFKLVLVIDGAPSEIVQIVKGEVLGDHRVKVIVCKSNRGVAKALNLGFAYLGQFKNIKYYTWVSSDNFYYEHFIKRLRRELLYADPDVGLVFSSFRHITPDGASLFGDEPFLKEFRSWQNKPKEELLDVCFIGTSFMYKKKFANQVGPYRREPVEDYDYWLRLTDFCNIQYTPQELMDYRVNSAYSVSLKLKNSKIEHRRWRYSFQMAKRETYNRRQIPFETTIIYGVNKFTTRSLRILEQLLDQYYSNYALLIVDETANGQVIRKFQDISDPRIAFFHLPQTSRKKFLENQLKHVKTPFTLLYGSTGFQNTMDLQNLVHHFQISSPSIQNDQNPFEENKLYRTHNLLRMLQIQNKNDTK